MGTINNMSFVTDLINAFVPTVAYAEEPVEQVSEDATVEESTKDVVDVAPAEEKEEEAEAEEDDDEEEEDEDDEDEEESEDQFDALKKECSQLPSVKPILHHYEECVERVTKEQEEPGYDEKEYKEDCVEEFFHLQHALTDCAAPKLFSKLK